MMKRCFLTGEYVFYAVDRAKRPHSFQKNKVQSVPKEYCPFCLENEHMTPKRVYGTEDNNIRIVPNMYPFMSGDGDNYCVHDVLIDTLNHDERLCEFTDEHMYQLMKVMQMRFKQLEDDGRLEYVQIFKNQGIDAGASQSHSHWQITAMGVVPLKMEHLLEVLSGYYGKNGKCYFCNLDLGDRVIDENDSFVVYMPADAKFAYEMDILPKRHISSIKDFNDNELKDFGIILRRSTARLRKLFDDISYNVCLYSAPKSITNEKCFHFYGQIIPRIGHMAGFEFSTGCYINSTLPEEGAKKLRAVEID